MPTYVVKGTDGQFYGPADLPTLNQWATEGRILADSVLVDQATNSQVLARDCPGLQHHFQLAPRPQPASYQSAQQAAPQYNPFSQPPGPSNYPRPGATPYAYSGPRKSKIAAALLAFFLGGFGIHRFYLGYTGLGVTMLLLGTVGVFLTCGITGIVVGVWAIVDFVLILCDQLKDVNGQSLE